MAGVEKSYLEHALIRIVKLYQISGQFPFQIRGTEVKKSAMMTIFAALVSIVVPALWAVILYNAVSRQTLFFSWLIFCEYVPIILVLLISPIWLWRHLGNLNEMLRLMKYVESSCKHRLDLRDVNRYFMEMYATVLVTILAGSCRMFVVVSHATITTGWRIYFAMICHILRSVLFSLVVGQFVGLCSLLSSTFRLLKYKMKEILGIPGLETIARDYEKVALAAQALQKLYSPQLLLIYSAAFAEINFNLYMSFLVSYDTPYKITMALWAGIFLWMSWWAISAVDLIKNQAEEFYIIYQHHIRRHGLRDYVPLNATLYIFALKRSEIKFSGFGLFTMDRKFLFSMCLATTTYVVMLKSLQ